MAIECMIVMTTGGNCSRPAREIGLIFAAIVCQVSGTHYNLVNSHAVASGFPHISSLQNGRKATVTKTGQPKVTYA